MQSPGRSEGEVSILALEQLLSIIMMRVCLAFVSLLPIAAYGFLDCDHFLNMHATGIAMIGLQ